MPPAALPPSPPADGAQGDAIVLVGVTHRYGDTLALDDVSLTLPRGRTIGLIGPDGVGKSSLLGLVAGVRVRQQGQVRVLGGDMTVRRQREALSPRIAYMPQGLGRNLYPTLTVYENIDFFARLFGLAAGRRRARIARLMAATGLAPFADRPAGKLSGGMKQKLGLCCALVHDPDLLILDEPTTGVDPLSRRQFWVLVDALRAESGHMTVVVATAYMEEAARFDHLVAMDAGRVLISAPMGEVLGRTGAATLEDAYVSLLPAARRGEGTGVVIPPYQDPGGPPAIAAHNLTRRFGDFIAVDDVSFTIGTGEIFGFLGSNGCGKTTTMKMLTGLLDISSGSARLLGQPVDAGDMATRLHIGYMSQGFSLYQELTVRQNLMLHARLYRVPMSRAAGVVDDALTDFALEPYAQALPGDLPLGIRQRLQLAAACLHAPEVLILDEPTSGVDPMARDMFWRHLVRLSRERGVTIFVSTHFMNEAARCDRISLMDRGRVLAVGRPDELAAGAPSLEDAFVDMLAQAQTQPQSQTPAPEIPPVPGPQTSLAPSYAGGWRGVLSRIWAFAWREGVELLRDRTRLGFALLGPVVLLLVAASSISFDVENIRFTVWDQDRTSVSRALIDQFTGSRYFIAQDPVASAPEGEAALRAGRAQLFITIPPHYGRDLAAGRRPVLGLSIDGAIPFTAANIQADASGVVLGHVADLARQTPGGGPAGGDAALPARVEPRFIYNQDFQSLQAMAPGVLMLAIVLIPTMLTALGVVREKEIGSITNLYASPAGVGEFLVGKQAPYVALAWVSYLSLVGLCVGVLGVPLKGSFLALSFGALLFIMAGTALGLLISTICRTQVAAIFGTAIVCFITSVNFSGFLYPVSTLTGGGYWVGVGFPSSWFQLISLGSFTKGLGQGSFWLMDLALGGFALAYLSAARLLLAKQER